MKLLLTSQGFTNQAIVDAFEQLVGKSITQSKIAVIPIASFYSRRHHGWWLDVMTNLNSYDPAEITLVDIAANTLQNCLSALNAADAIFVTGGNAAHLMYWLDESGLSKKIKTLLESKVYVGNSAGSVIMGPDLQNAWHKVVQYKKETGREASRALGLVDFYISPHFNEGDADRWQEPAVAAFADTVNQKVYAIDDNSAVVVDGDKVLLVGGGQAKVFN